MLHIPAPIKGRLWLFHVLSRCVLHNIIAAPNYFLPITLSAINDSFSSHHAKYRQWGHIVERLETNHIQKCANIRTFKKQGISSLISRTVQFICHMLLDPIHYATRQLLEFVLASSPFEMDSFHELD